MTTETRPQTQLELIRAALLAGRALTPLEALREFGCFRLGARIWELRHEEGMEIAQTLVETTEGAHVAQYRLVAPVEPEQGRML